MRHLTKWWEGKLPQKHNLCVCSCAGAEERTAAHMEVDAADSRRRLFPVAAWWAGTHADISALFLFISFHFLCQSVRAIT